MAARPASGLLLTKIPSTGVQSSQTRRTFFNHERHGTRFLVCNEGYWRNMADSMLNLETILSNSTLLIFRNAYRFSVYKTHHLAVRHRHGRVVAMVEIVSPGNKASNNELRTFVDKTSKLIAQGIHMLVIDLFSPSKRDPQGIHKAIMARSRRSFHRPGGAGLPCDLSNAGIDPLAQVVRERFDDERHIEPAMNVIVGQNAAVGENEDVFGLETFGQRDGGAAVGVVGAGGSEPGGLPQDAAEETGQFADQQAGPAPLVDRFLARLLDVGAEGDEPGRGDRSRARRPPRRSTTGETARARRRPARWRG